MTEEFDDPQSARALTVRTLLELVAALDRRVPQVRRAGEPAIASAAAALRAAAVSRVEELDPEHDHHVQPVPEGDEADAAALDAVPDAVDVEPRGR